MVKEMLMEGRSEFLNRAQKSKKIVNQYNWHAVSYQELCQLTFS